MTKIKTVLKGKEWNEYITKHSLADKKQLDIWSGPLFDAGASIL